MQRPSVELLSPSSPGHLGEIRTLFREYAETLNVDLCFQGFDAELASLPGAYAEPGGCLFLALVDGVPAGCCALRSLSDVDHANACEIKRLYVRPAFRGLRLGRQLADAIMERARDLGYDCVLLDTLDEMETARALYHDLGFVEIPPYYHNPISGAHYLKARLQ